jgi:hypothetical protein
MKGNMHDAPQASGNRPNTFSVTRHAGGTVELTCAPDGENG